MGTIRILNTDDIQGVINAAGEAGAAAQSAAEAAQEAATLAREAAEQVATLDVLLPQILAVLRAEVGGAEYNRRGPWSPTETYRKDDLVSHALSDGTIGAFVATGDVPVGTPPTDPGFWKPYGVSPDAAGLDVVVNLGAEALRLVPGGTATAQVQVKRVNLPLTAPLTFDISSNEPGLSGTLTLDVESVGSGDAENELPVGDDELLGESGEVGRVSLYTLTVAASGATPEGSYELVISARAAEWVDEPSSPLYAVRDTETVTVVASKVATEVAPGTVALYGMHSPDAYLLADFLKDGGPNALHLIRKGDVRPNSRGDGLICEGTPGSVLHTPPLTGLAMNGPLELLVIVADPRELPDGTVVAAFASTARKHDYGYVYKTKDGFKLRTGVQNGAGTGAVTRDSDGVVPLGSRVTRLGVSADPASGQVTLHNIYEAKTVSVPVPAWAAGGVRASAYGVLLADDTVLLPSAGQVLAMTLHNAVLSTIRRFETSQKLMDDAVLRDTEDARPEYPSGTRLILEMKEGEPGRDRTYYDPAKHDLIAHGDASADEGGGIRTTGATGSGWRTDWLPDLTWDKSFSFAFYVRDFFSEPVGGPFFSIASENDVSAWMKMRATPVYSAGGNQFDATLSVPSAVATALGVQLKGIGNRPAHLFLFEYDAAKRLLSVSETFSGATLSSGPLTIPATYTGMLGLAFGLVYRGKQSNGVYSGLHQTAPTRHGGCWGGARLYNAAEKRAALDALGVAAAELPPLTPSSPTVPGTPPPQPPPPPPATGSTLVGVADWSESRLGSGDLKKVFTDLAKIGWLYLPNSKRGTDTVGEYTAWDPDLAKQYKIKTHGGKQYREYTGPNCGAYYIGRGIAKLAYRAVSGAFRATKDLRILDVACADLEAMVDCAKDDAGIGSDRPDGFKGFSYGCNAQQQIFFSPGDSRNTARVKDGQIRYANSKGEVGEGCTKMSGIETQLEDGLWQAFMIIADAANENRDKFSPTFEPPGNRPAQPAYYKRIVTRALALYEDTCAKWDKYYVGKPEEDLPMHIRRELIHSGLGEVAAKIAYARIKRGAAWKTSSEYAESRRAWNLIFGETEKVGYYKNVHMSVWHEAKHPKWGKCLFWAHRIKRYYPGKTKDATGEYLSSNSQTQFVHPNDYTDHDYGAIQYMYESGCDFVPLWFLQGCANTVLATLTLGEKFERNGKMSPTPYLMNGNNHVESLRSPWGGSKSNSGTNNQLLANTSAALLAAYDTHGELEGVVREHYNKYGGVKTYGATSGLLFAAARRENRL